MLVIILLPCTEFLSTAVISVKHSLELTSTSSIYTHAPTDRSILRAGDLSTFIFIAAALVSGIW